MVPYLRGVRRLASPTSGVEAKQSERPVDYYEYWTTVVVHPI